MTEDDIDDAVVEAKRFLDKVYLFRARIKNDAHFHEFYKIVGGKETGAIRRASMDLTRALAKMRR